VWPLDSPRDDTAEFNALVAAHAAAFRRRRPQTVRNLSPPLVIGMTVSTAVREGSLRDQPSHDDPFRYTAAGAAALQA